MNKDRGHIALFCLAFTMILLTSSCVHFCYESPSRIKLAATYTSQIPLTIKDLKRKIDYDTSEYKLIVLYSPCCGACRKRFGDTYSRLWHELDTSLVSWYFVQIDCGGVKWNEKFLNSFGINTTMYYIRDDSPEYQSSDGNITNCLFGRHITNYPTGTPTTYILDRLGTLKMACYTLPDGTSSVEPMELYHLSVPLEKMDFQTIDTLMWTF